MPAIFPLNDLSLRTKEALIRGAIWSFIGSLYGMIFKFFYSLAEYWSLPISSILFAGTLAATLAALIYSSMTLAFIVATASSLVSLIYVLSAGDLVDIVNLGIVCAVFGAAFGALYGYKAKSSRVYRADAKTLAGLTAGAIVSLLYFVISQAFSSINLVLTITVLCLFTGALYIAVVTWFIHRFNHLLPAIGDGAIVGAGTGLFVSILFFLMITGVTPEVAGEHRLLTEIIRYQLLSAAFGGMLGGGIAGFTSGWLLRGWLDL